MSKKVFGNEGKEVEKPTLELRVSAPFLDDDGEEYYASSITMSHPDEGEIAGAEAWMLEAVYHGREQLEKLARLFEMGLVKQAITRAQQIRLARHKLDPTEQINAAAAEAQKLANKKEA